MSRKRFTALPEGVWYGNPATGLYGITFSRAVRPREQLGQLAGVLRLVVDAGQQHILERQPAAGDFEIPIGRGEDLGQADVLVDRHDLVAQLVVRSVQRHGQVIARVQLAQPMRAAWAGRRC